ncbi:MAG TPA: CocE/NonD family hydrolase [Humisphaera sp.]
MSLRPLARRFTLALAVAAAGVLPAHPGRAQPTPAAPGRGASPAAPRPPAKPYGNLPANPLPGDRLLDAYFAGRTAALEARCLAEVKTLDDWNAKKGEYRRQLAEMLGLDPMPPRTDLKPVVTGTVDHPEFTVEKLHFQSSPGLYVGANLYVPKNAKGKLPAILYVCGHSDVKDPKTGKPLGNKTGYQHHGEWFARNGYVCLTIDTIQLGEIPGAHHGLYKLNQWWWASRGYTPAGVEAWNAIRAIDYLQSRPEVDGGRIGMTGRSGGGAYTWYTAALDERVKACVPVAGITDLRNHVVDGCIEGHCDCMFMTNTYRWDFAQVAALVAPRPMLISNTDKDTIFPLDGVNRVHEKVRRIYQLNGAADKLGLLITEGPHKDTQYLQVPAFRWFNRFLKGETEPVKVVAEKLFEPAQLRVFESLPADEITTKVQQTFVPKAAPLEVPDVAGQWDKNVSWKLDALRRQTFAAWPESNEVPKAKVETSTANGVDLKEIRFDSQPNAPVTVHVFSGAKPGGKPPELVVLNVVDQTEWAKALATFRPEFGDRFKGLTLPDVDPTERESTLRMLKNTNWAMAYVAVRGVGETAWSGDAKRLTHLRRRFVLLGETLDGQRAFDVVQAARVVKAVEGLGGAKVWLQGERRMAGVALFASLFAPGVDRLDLWHLPPTLDGLSDGPEFLNVLKVLDVPQAVALAAGRSKVVLYADAATDAWAYPLAVGKALKWDEDRVRVRTVPATTRPAGK